jgi:hypothetical protein
VTFTSSGLSTKAFVILSTSCLMLPPQLEHLVITGSTRTFYQRLTILPGRHLQQQQLQKHLELRYKLQQ